MFLFFMAIQDQSMILTNLLFYCMPPLGANNPRDNPSTFLFLCKKMSSPLVVYLVYDYDVGLLFTLVIPTTQHVKFHFSVIIQISLLFLTWAKENAKKCGYVRQSLINMKVKNGSRSSQLNQRCIVQIELVFRPRNGKIINKA